MTTLLPEQYGPTATSGLRALVNFASATGRLVLDVGGDSTAERNGHGHAWGFAAGMFGVVPCAGILMPANHSSPNNDTHGYYLARRRQNGGTVLGVASPADLATPGYPATFKQYGPQVPMTASWQGPQAAYLALTTLNGAIDNAVTTITLTDASAFRTSGRVLIESEIIQYSGKSGNQLTGCTRGNLSTSAAAHADTTNVQAMDNGDAINGFVQWQHPLHNAVALVSSLWYMSVSAGVVSGATVKQEILSVASLKSSDAWTVSQAVGSPTNMTGAAVGTITRMDISLAADSGRDKLSLGFGTDDSNGTGPFGPACILYTGLFASLRPFGAIQAMGISQGGKRCNEMYTDLRIRHAATGTVEYDLGYVSRFKVYIDAAAAGVGGNGAAGVALVRCFGHNEASGGGYHGLVDPTEAWTIGYTLALSADINDAVTTIALVSVTGLSTAGGHVLIGSERITYTGISGTSLTGCTRGAIGTTAAAHVAANEPVYAGYPCHHPLGLAADICYDYKLMYSLWQTAGGNPSYFWYVWVRPIPVSAAPTYGDLFSSASATNAAKEGRLQEYQQYIEAHLSGRPGFCVADHSLVWRGDETLTYGYGADTTDMTHNSRQAYERSWSELLARETFVNGWPPRGRR